MTRWRGVLVWGLARWVGEVGVVGVVGVGCVGQPARGDWRGCQAVHEDGAAGACTLQ